MDKDKVLNLAKLARISIDEGEAENLSKEFETILNYVGEIKKAEGDDLAHDKENYPIRNVLREDEIQNQEGEFTEDILKNAPGREGNYLKVKNIL